MQDVEPSLQNGKWPISLLKEHLELAALEWGYEKQEGQRRLLSLGIGGIFLVFSFGFLQLALIGWLLRMGLGWEGIGMTLGACYFVLGGSVIWFFGRRQKGLGPPFQGSLTELKRSLGWIDTHFFHRD